MKIDRNNRNRVGGFLLLSLFLGMYILYLSYIGDYATSFLRDKGILVQIDDRSISMSQYESQQRYARYFNKELTRQQFIKELILEQYLQDSGMQITKEEARKLMAEPQYQKLLENYGNDAYKSIVKKELLTYIIRNESIQRFRRSLSNANLNSYYEPLVCDLNGARIVSFREEDPDQYFYFYESIESDALARFHEQNKDRYCLEQKRALVDVAPCTIKPNYNGDLKRLEQIYSMQADRFVTQELRTAYILQVDESKVSTRAVCKLLDRGINPELLDKDFVSIEVLHKIKSTSGYNDTNVIFSLQEKQYQQLEKNPNVIIYLHKIFPAQFLTFDQVKRFLLEDNLNGSFNAARDKVIEDLTREDFNGPYGDSKRFWLDEQEHIPFYDKIASQAIRDNLSQGWFEDGGKIYKFKVLKRAQSYKDLADQIVKDYKLSALEFIYNNADSNYLQQVLVDRKSEEQKVSITRNTTLFDQETILDIYSTKVGSYLFKAHKDKLLVLRVLSTTQTPEEKNKLVDNFAWLVEENQLVATLKDRYRVKIMN